MMKFFLQTPLLFRAFAFLVALILIASLFSAQLAPISYVTSSPLG